MSSANIRLSVSMALDALADQVQRLHDAEAEVIEQRSIRDDLIRDARDSGVGFTRLARITGLSRDRLWNIYNSGRQK